MTAKADKTPEPTPDAMPFVRGKSAHELLRLIGTGELPEGITPALIGQADTARVIAKAALRVEG